MKSAVAAGMIGLAGVLGAVGCSSAPETFEDKMRAVEGYSSESAMENMIEASRGPQLIREIVRSCNRGLTASAIVHETLGAVESTAITAEGGVAVMEILMEEYCAV